MLIEGRFHWRFVEGSVVKCGCVKNAKDVAGKSAEFFSVITKCFLCTLYMTDDDDNVDDDAFAFRRR